MPDRRLLVGESLRIGDPSAFEQNEWRTIDLEDVKAGRYILDEIRERGRVKSLILLHEEKANTFIPPTCLKCWGQIEIEKEQVAVTGGLFSFSEKHLLSSVENGSYFVYTNFGKIKDVIILDLSFNGEKILCEALKKWHRERK